MASWSRRPASVAISGSSAWVAAEVQSSTPLERAEGRDQVAAALLEVAFRARVVTGGAAHLRRQLGLAPSLQPVGVLGVDRRAHLAQEAQVALARLAAHRLELVTQHGGHPNRHRRAVEQVEQREVHARHGLPEPLLAERPGAEALDVGHVRVQHQRERPRPLPSSGAHAGTGLGQRPASRGASRQERITSTPIRMAGSGASVSMATVLKAAWIAITANSEPVRS